MIRIRMGENRNREKMNLKKNGYKTGRKRT